MASQETDYTQIEVFPNEAIETVAQRLAASAPASCIYDGVEILADVGQSAENIANEYRRYRRRADVQKRLEPFAISLVEIVAAESPGPGGKIDPHLEIREPIAGVLYLMWERRPDHSVGNVAVVLVDPSDPQKLLLQHGPVVAALGSLLVEHSYRAAAAEARIATLEARVEHLAARATAS